MRTGITYRNPGAGGAVYEKVDAAIQPYGRLAG